MKKIAKIKKSYFSIFLNFLIFFSRTVLQALEKNCCFQNLKKIEHQLSYTLSTVKILKFVFLSLNKFFKTSRFTLLKRQLLALILDKNWQQYEQKKTNLPFTALNTYTSCIFLYKQKVP